MNSQPPVITALLSYGMSGEVFHAPLLHAHPGFKIKSIVERKSSKARLYYPDVNILRSIDEVLNDPEIELVVVNTPNAYHAEHTTQVLKAGKHAVVEKPFTTTVAEAQSLIELADKTKKILSVFQSRRWDGAFMTVRKIIDSGVLGTIVEYEARYDRFRNSIAANTWKEEAGPGAGILYNLGSHLLDQVLVLFGQPESVSARLGVQRPKGKVDDFYDLRLAYPGLNVIVKSSYLVREPSPFYTIHGTSGSFVKYGADPQEEALKLHQVPTGPGWGSEPESFWGKLNTEVNGLHVEGRIETLAGNYSDFYQNIFNVLREGAALAVTPQQGMQVIQVIEAAIQSDRERRSIAL